MDGPEQTDQSLLEAIRRGDAEAWARLIDEYQGRLLRFAMARVAQRADAEDIVQETFTAFVKVAGTLQIEASLETYLFAIVRNEIVNRFRTHWSKRVCLIQDVYRTGTDDAPVSPLAQVPASDPSVSWYVRRDEQRQLQRQALAEALSRVVGELREKEKLRDLKVAELAFYCQVSNADIARQLELDGGLVRVVKHRCLKRIREAVTECYASADESISFSDDVLTQIWETRRLSCPGRETLNEFLRERLSPQWFDYVDFHLTTLGCHFCRASYKDLQERHAGDRDTRFQRRVMNTTIALLTKTQE
jgi:RNA polymerase sigma-70 factor (ECF subfamily)